MGSIITCPHCSGTGYRCEDEDRRICGLCFVRWWEDAGTAGALELPLSPLHAERAYTCACSQCYSLVAHPEDDESATACPDCTPERTCYGCWAFGAGPDDGALSW
jgi:hypothetical protein